MKNRYLMLVYSNCQPFSCENSCIIVTSTIICMIMEKIKFDESNFVSVHIIVINKQPDYSWNSVIKMKVT